MAQKKGKEKHEHTPELGDSICKHRVVNIGVVLIRRYNPFWTNNIETKPHTACITIMHFLYPRCTG